MKNTLSRFDWSYVYAFLGEATLALTFIFYILIARVLGPEEYGIFAAAIALASILALFIQFGLPTLINREVAAHPDTATRKVSLFLVLESITSMGVLIALLPLSVLLGYRGEVLLVSYLAIFTEISRALIMTLRSAIKGLGWFRAESIAVAIERVTVVAVATAILFHTESLVLVIASVAITRIVHVIGLLIYMSRQVNIFTSINWQKLWSTLKVAYPFAMSGVLWVLYYQVDVVMLKTLSTGEETGFYSASYRILEMFSALPRVIFYVIFTRFAKYHVSAPEKLPEQLYKATRILLVVVIPAIVVAGLIQTQLIGILYGEEFSQSLKSLSILLPSLAVKMFNTIPDQFLQATGREKKMPQILTVAAAANIAINALLIPRFASVGAAIATLISEFIVAALGLRILGQVGYPRSSQNISLILIISFFTAAIPTLMIYGLPLLLGGLLLLPCLFILIARIKFRYFQESTAS